MLTVSELCRNLGVHHTNDRTVICETMEKLLLPCVPHHYIVTNSSISAPGPPDTIYQMATQRNSQNELELYEI